MPTPRAYYNEFDPKAAAWLRELIKEGHIASGDVDERSIAEVRPADLAGYTQCHFFAGIGGWSYALRLAGWPDDRPVWTGSCPCQPFSAAGRRGGTDDARHLWPEFYRLIRECRPATVFGEQVASKDGLAWLDIVSTDLERAGYAVGAADMCAAGVGAPHIRQRLYFVADHGSERRQWRPDTSRPIAQDARQRRKGMRDVEPRGEYGGLAHSHGPRLEVGGTHEQRANGIAAPVARSDASDVEHAKGNGRIKRRPESSKRGFESRCAFGDVGNTQSINREIQLLVGESQQNSSQFGGSSGVGDVADIDGRDPSAQREQRSGEHRFQPQDNWSCDWLPCTDGKARPVEPLAQQMANGLSFAVGLVRGFSNAEKEALTGAAKSTGFTAEVLRQMQDGVRPAEIWDAIGRCVGFPETSILLAFLCEQSRELGRFFYGQTSGGAQERETAMRAMRKIWPFACTPQGREFSKQRAAEFGDAMPAMPQESALLTAFNGFPLAVGVPGRVGLLRGYGNAIVPQVAAEFVGAYLDTL